jgi:NAD(P)-dependent dehydrogenase (short-subunit alcohol dehydrogenase family)
MSSLQGKVAIVVGASSGVGKATAELLVSEGARVTAVARGQDGLGRLRAEIGERLETFQADAADSVTADRLLRELKPDLVVVAAGTPPHMAPIDEQSWETFSAPWNADLKAAFHFIKGAIALPLRPGSTVVVVSSGAAINGSHLSGGYAGAKRMQWLLAGYAQQRSDVRKLGIRFLAFLPKQLIEGTVIGARASSAYAPALGLTPEGYMKRFEVPLDAQKVAAGIVAGLRGEVPAGVTAMAVTGKGVESLA